MRILVTGSEGQVARALLEKGCRAGHEIVAVGRPDFDLLDRSSIMSTIRDVRPELVVSAAAYTAVDHAESDQIAAKQVNAQGAGYVAQAAAAAGAPIVHLSTDYVFDGEKSEPYVETDAARPRSIYGATKLEGEFLVAAAQPRSVILRTSWVYAPYGSNFVRTMLRVGEASNSIRVVADQFGCPTSALDIADGILQIAKNFVSRPHESSLFGIFHMAGNGEATWADLAEAVFERALLHGRLPVNVERIAATDYPRPAIRPRNSRLNCGKLHAIHDVSLAYWRSSLNTVVDRLLVT